MDQITFSEAEYKQKKRKEWEREAALSVIYHAADSLHAAFLQSE